MAMARFRKLLLLTIIPLAALYAEQDLYLRIEPGANVPIRSGRFDGPGFGVAAGLDWAALQAPFSFPWLGAGLSGAFSSFTVKTGDSLSLFEGSLGPLFQWRFTGRFTLRGEINAGVYTYMWRGESDTRMRYGGSLTGLFHISPYISASVYGGYTHYAASGDPLMRSFKAGAGISINLPELFGRPSRVSGSKTEQYPVFPVSYAWYEDNPVAAVSITNNEPNAISAVEVSLFFEQFMNEPTVSAFIPGLDRGESVTVPLTAFFNEAILDLTGNITGNAVVLINYRSLGARKSASLPLVMPVYHRNAMSWDDDRRAASFVSAKDPLAILFARYVESVAAGRLRPGIPKDIQYALGLFEILNVYGIKYLIDPASSYVELSESASVPDSLNYPYQTLLYRGGDCDDLSILFCSLLEALKVETAFITIPGHIYMAFAVDGDAGALARALDGGIITHGGKAWIPLEITIPAEGFYRAWRTGVEQWEKAGEAARIYPLRESWAVYPPVSVPAAGTRTITLPGEPEAAGAFERELQNFSARTRFPKAP
jgi:hypothetical protein